MKKISAQKNLFSPFLLILVLVFLGAYFVWYNTRLINPPNTLNLQIISLNDETKLYKITGQYPVFPVSEKLSSEIKLEINNKITDFKKNVKENWNERQKNSLPDEKIGEFPEKPWPLKVTWAGEDLNNNYISFVLRFSSFQGGANNVEELKTFNFDLTNKKEVFLSDLFPNNPNYLKTVSDFTKTDLLSQFQNDANFPIDFIDTGTKPTLENFQYFNFNDENIVFYFPKYQVAPGAYGEQKVVMPR